jgi:flagellar biosynthesis protein FlhA
MPTTDNVIRPHGITAALTGTALPVLIVLSLMVVIVPVHPMILDLLLSANMTAAVLILLTSLFVARPLDFHAFPSLLLIATLARLVLNVASTRLILTRAATHGTDAAGDVIQTFARFVAQDQLAVGLVVFAILFVVQFVVVTKGATRLSEVAARFSLDGMPGRQMAVDADLNAGVITADEAKRRRADITAQADFHAAMDGAGKFVRGDALAGIFITLVNLIGGLVIGVVQYRMNPLRAAEVFALLTIGDGLAVQIPSFLIGLSAALLATRSSSESNVSREMISQTMREPAALYLAAAATFALAFTGLPMLPLMMLGAGCAITGESLRQQKRLAEAQRLRVAAAAQQQPATPAARLEDQLTVEPIELELGVRLIRLATAASGETGGTAGGLMERIGQLRHRIAQELGILLPKIKVRDSLRLREQSYQIRLRGVVVAKGELRPEQLFAVETSSITGHLPGDESHESTSGQHGKWIERSLADAARDLGYKVVEPVQLLIGHLTEIVRSHSDELLTREHLHQLLEHLRQTSPRVVDELIPGLLKPAHVHQILSNLLRERVPIRDLETILEALGDHSERTTDTAVLTEFARQALSRTLCQPYRDTRGTIHALTIDPALEDVLFDGMSFSQNGPIVKLTPQVTEGVAREISRQVKKLVREGLPAVVVCSPRVRRVLRHITSGPLPTLAVLGLNEIPRDIVLRSFGQIPLNAIKIPAKNETRDWILDTGGMPRELVPSSF